MFSSRSYEFKHWTDITIADLPFVESPFFAANYADRCLRNDFKVGEVVNYLSGSHFRSSFGGFPGRGSRHFKWWRDRFIRQMEYGEILLVFKDGKEPFSPIAIKDDEGVVPTNAEPLLAERLITRANPAPPPPPALTGEVMEVSPLLGNPGWISEPKAVSNYLKGPLPKSSEEIEDAGREQMSPPSVSNGGFVVPKTDAAAQQLVRDYGAAVKQVVLDHKATVAERGALGTVAEGARKTINFLLNKAGLPSEFDENWSPRQAQFDQQSVGEMDAQEQEAGFVMGRLASDERSREIFKEELGEAWDVVSEYSLSEWTPLMIEAGALIGATAITRKFPDMEEVSSKKSGFNDNSICSPGIRNVCKRGEPISMVTGEELLDLTDFTVAGPLPIIWKRTYKSSNPHQRGLGVGWTHMLCQQLEEQEGRLVFTTDEGRYIDFPLAEPGQTVRNAAEHLELRRIDDTHYVLKQRGEPIRLFVGAGGVYRLEGLLDGVGNGVRIQYWQDLDGYERPVTLIQTSWGKRLYVLHNAQGLICEIQSLRADGDVDTLVRYEYDDAQDLAQVRDPAGAGESYAYRNHVITRRTLKTGFSFYFEWSRYDKAARCVRQWGDQGVYDYRFEWDPANKTSHAIDSNGGRTTFHYDDRGQIVKEIDPEGGITRRAYDNAGNLVEQTDPNGHSTHYAYNDNGQLTALIDANGGHYKIDYNDDGMPVAITNALGHVWRREYNEQGLLARITDPEGAQTQYEYNEQGLPQKIIDALGQARELQWNREGQLVSETDNQHTTRYAYNAQGQVRAATDHQGQTTAYQYDRNGNVTEVKRPDGSVLKMRYNANDQLTHFIDAAGRCTEYVYDGLAQVRKRIDPAGQTFEYLYDKERNLIGLINEKGERYELAYDRNERLIQEIGFDGRVQQYQYDPAGHLKAHIEGVHDDERIRAQHTTLFKRDPLGRLREKHSPDGDISRFAYNANGQLTQASNPYRTLEFAYTPTGRLAEEIQDGQRLRHEYNPLGARIQSLLPNGGVLGFGYDRHGLFTQASFNGDVLASIERDEDGRELRRRQGAAESRYDYDVMGRLIRHRVSHRQSKARIIERSYGYDASGNLALIDDLKKGTTHYRYDALDRLKTVEGYCNEEFAFDPAGNILDGQNQAKGNRLNFHGDRHFEYDAAGNLILEKRGKGGRLETRYQYNKQNQLIAIEKDGQKTEYQYDALGRRIAKQDAFGKTEFLWNGDVLLSEQRNHLHKIYVYEPNSFRPLAFIQDKQVYHYHLDHLGTPQEMTNAEGEVVWSARYKAYGNLALKDVEDVQNPLRFQGQYYDEETGLHYNRHRYYDPSAARFINQDPVGLLGGDNNYQYAPNPTGWGDPFGLTCKEGKELDNYRIENGIGFDKNGVYRGVIPFSNDHVFEIIDKNDVYDFDMPGRTPGHSGDKHKINIKDPKVLEILNSPDRIFTGRNKWGNHVDIYYKEGSAVFTDAGNKRSIISVYGRIEGKKKTRGRWRDAQDVKIDQWVDPEYKRTVDGQESVVGWRHKGDDGSDINERYAEIDPNDRNARINNKDYPLFELE
ncbi:Rhs family protein [Hahella chejuensis KCTC 2396]|uniref:Rhs family protein n=1 Tax=Hahella chejuensis (strain KCTC 2396) TaxID=349521 RepID=Q2SKM2_HAHCH|nr:Rhs family protein [Hahella chejuensis KCTC 2396]